MTTAEQTITTLLAQLLHAVESITDPAERARLATVALNGIADSTSPATGVQARLKTARHTAVQQLRANGASHADVAAALGVTRARAQQIATGTSASGRRPKTG